MFNASEFFLSPPLASNSQQRLKARELAFKRKILDLDEREKKTYFSEKLMKTFFFRLDEFHGKQISIQIDRLEPKIYSVINENEIKSYS
jgi:hypothetical protein